MRNESYLADQWLYETLIGDVSLSAIVGTRVYSDEAPPNAIFPYLQWNLISAVDIKGQSTFRIMANCLYVVKLVGKSTTYGSLMPASDRMHTLIDGKGGDTVAGDHVYSCSREEPYRLTEYVSGVSYRHLGGVFRIFVQKG